MEIIYECVQCRQEFDASSPIEDLFDLASLGHDENTWYLPMLFPSPRDCGPLRRK